MGGKVTKSSLNLTFNNVNSTVPVSKVLGTEVLSVVENDLLIKVTVKGKFQHSSYVLSVDNPEFIERYNYLLGVFRYDLVTVIFDTNTVIYIAAFRSDNTRLKFSDIRSLIKDGMLLNMQIIIESVDSIQVDAINFDFQTIESTDKTGNINVYANNNGGTNYYDTAIPVQVTMGVVSNLSNSTGDYILNMRLVNGRLTLLNSLPFVVDYEYYDNRLNIVCSEARDVALRVKITDAIEGVPPLLTLVPSYSGINIFVNFVGTIMRTVPNYAMEFALYIHVY